MKIELEDITFGYSEKNVLDGITFTAEGTQFVSILGPNGVGKSTLIHCMNRILTPKSGTVRLDGTDVRDIPPKELA